MANHIPYHVIHNILQIAELSIESKIAFKIHKPIIRSLEFDIKLNDLCKKRIYYQDNYKKVNYANIISWHICDEYKTEIILFNMSTHNEITINKYYKFSSILEYSKIYNVHTGEIII